jgi:tetratricopeptide (TPR) repeat protein
MRVLPQQVDNPQLARSLMTASPYAPAARASTVATNWPAAEKYAETWEKESQHPTLLIALGKRYAELQRPDDAERCLKRALALSPDRNTNRKLAETYKAQGKMDLWQETLEDYLKGEDTGLDHAQVCVELARYFMARKEWKRAQPYAEAAAETWAEWAMYCAAECAEGLGDWETADQWMQRASTRYANSYAGWYLWCLRTGKGNVQAAEQLVKEHLQELDGQLGTNDLMVWAALQLTAGQPKPALEALKRVSQQKPSGWVALNMALVCDELKDREGRDKALQSVDDHVWIRQLADLFAKCLSKGEKENLEADAVEKVLKEMPAEWRADSCYFIGRFLELRGHTKAALPYLNRSATDPRTLVDLLPALASARLRANGTEPGKVPPGAK